jgi:hypothetical protein
MTVVREEFGPTLPELLGPRLGVRVRTLWLVVAGLAVVAIALAGWLALRPKPGRTYITVRDPVTFNLQYTKLMNRVAPRTGEVLRLQTPAGLSRQSMVVRPLHLAPYRGDVTAALTFLSAKLIDEMSGEYQDFAYRGDGRVNVNKQPGYAISFQAHVNGHTTYGRRVLLVATADPAPREGIDVTMLAERSPAVPNADSVAGNGALKTPYRSLRFGTDHP